MALIPENPDEDGHEEEMDTTEYTDSLIAFLQEKEKEYQARGVAPTLENLIKDLAGSK